ncbi:DNA polymerase III subunit gamma/tau C-terminal domain-containing protein [Candidatus Erwinia haradaeae]|uniref:DNA polymerase III subunit gamma/tau C-terminal domain-containing protein n=1 Tax=Candidatus Erwinia haradaeae TaxID=1922217 RepID=UPI0012FE958E|nr:DNA polymerase III subunit gamma/tau C-terminal domain-containing protein [Candidatus Erwinia haradaeae]
MTRDIHKYKDISNPEFVLKIIEESWKRDTWSADLDRLNIPDVGYQLALHSWREVTTRGFCLHIHSIHSHFNTPQAYQALYNSLTKAKTVPLKLIVLEDDKFSILTPLDWRYKIYEEKLVAARKSVFNDTNIQTLCHFFDASVEENSIWPT